MYKFKIPIGDWSKDGHGMAEWYVINSNRPLEDVRELYFRACDKLGYNLDSEGPCSEYGDYIFPLETLQELIGFGVKLPTYVIEHIEDPDWGIDTESYLEIVLALIRTQDSNLELSVVEDVEMFQFYGFGKDKRHIGYFGYGLFDC